MEGLAELGWQGSFQHDSPEVAALREKLDECAQSSLICAACCRCAPGLRALFAVLLGRSRCVWLTDGGVQARGDRRP